jgi:lysyl-tRNA synthetase class 2
LICRVYKKYTLVNYFVLLYDFYLVMHNLELSEQEIIRRQSLDELRELGIEPYPASGFDVDSYSIDIKNEFEDDSDRRNVKIAGRIMSRRIMGKASFVELMDSKGRIQVYITRDDICPDENKELYNTVFKKLLDIGDFIGIEGFVFRTKTGEISVHAEKLTVLSKSLRPLPVVKMKDGVAFDKFTDPELRYRQRYVDLLVNEDVKDIFTKRTKIFDAMREFFNNEGYLEVDTPVLQSIPGGAAARPFSLPVTSNLLIKPLNASDTVKSPVRLLLSSVSSGNLIVQTPLFTSTRAIGLSAIYEILFSLTWKSELSRRADWGNESLTLR